MALKTFPFDVADYLTDDETIAEYLMTYSKAANHAT
jgi:hypothetical protein